LGILVCVVGTSLLSAYIHGKGFGYHLGAIMPSFAIPISACLVGVFEAWKERRAWSRSVIHASAILIALLGLGKKVRDTLSNQIEWYLGRRSLQAMLASQDPGIEGSPVARMVAAAEFIQRTSSRHATLLTVPRPVGVNFLSQRRSPSRFITFGMLSTLDDRLVVSRKWSAEFARMMATTPP